MHKFLFAFIFGCLFCGPLLAQERGRLSDGRAYRTGADGVEIVDYIAELELVNAGLRDQVQSLENELDERSALLNRFGNEDASSDAHHSKTREMEKLREQLRQEQARSNKLQATLVEIKSAYATQEKDLESVRELHRAALVERRAGSESEVALLRAKNSELTQKSRQKDVRIAELKNEKRGLEKRLESNLKDARAESDLREELRVTKAQLSEALSRLQQYDTRASLRPASTKARTREEAPSEGYIALFKKKYQSLRTLTRQREALAQKLALKNTGVQLSQSAPKSRRGISLSYLTSRYNVIIKNSSNAKNFIADASDLEAKLKEDIGVAERMLQQG